MCGSLARRVGGVGAVLVVWGALSVAFAGQSGWQSLVGSGCAAASGVSHAGLVVDFGTVSSVPGAPTPTVQSTCVAFSNSDELGTDVLTAAGYDLRFNSVGLLCAIDGYPATGCGAASSSGYQYWSYWHGGSSWTYAVTGPAGYRVSNGGVEGWRFVEGGDSAAEGAPRPSSKGPCPTASTTSTSTTRATAPGSGSSSPPSTTAAGLVGPGATIAAGAGHAPSTTKAAGAAGADPSSTATTSGAGATSDDVPTRQLAAPAGHARRPGSGSPVGAAAVGATIVGLALAALFISRHRATP